MDLEEFVRDVPDFPSAGILFKDITPLLQSPDAMAHAAAAMAEPFAQTNIDTVAAIEARGFLFGPLIAQHLGLAFVPIRKPGKLPPPTSHVDYDLEYGSDRLELRHDNLTSSRHVLLVDDVLATGGTLRAAKSLLEQAGDLVLGVSVLIELMSLTGRSLLGDVPFASAIEVH